MKTFEFYDSDITRECSVCGVRTCNMLILREDKKLVDMRVCNKLDCLTQVVEKLRNNQVDKTKTNEIGPRGPGFPGCALNGD
ncbi:MAG: hypothetical protein HY225_02985 [Candidatus Vogelbacteria bacterium]|nr:hypothetical protein [Candidatus Vogelbacteria bacterium]